MLMHTKASSQSTKKPLNESKLGFSAGNFPAFSQLDEEKFIEDTISRIPFYLSQYQRLKDEAKSIAEKNKHASSKTAKQKIQQMLNDKLQQCNVFKKEALQGTAAALSQLAARLWVQSNYNKMLNYYKSALFIYQSISQASEGAAETLNKMGSTYYDLGEWSQSLSCYEQAIQLYQRIGATEDKIAEVLDNRAGLFKRQGKYGAAEEDASRSLVIKKNLFGDKHSSLIAPLCNLGEILLEKRADLDRAQNYFQDAMSIVKLSSDNKEGMAMEAVRAGLLHSMAAIYALRGQYKQAQENSQRAFQIKKRIFGEESDPVARSLICLGDIFARQGKIAQAFPYLQKGLAMHRKVSGDTSWQVAESLEKVGNLLLEQGDYQEALSHQEQALTIRLKIFGEKHPAVAETYLDQANIVLQQGHYSQALDLCQRALAIHKDNAGEKSAVTARALSVLGNVHYKQGDFKTALDVYLKAKTIYHEAESAASSNIATVCMNIGSAYAELKNFEQAFSHYDQSLAIDKRVFGEESSGFALKLSNIAHTLAEQHRYAEAVPYYEKALAIYQRLQGNEHYMTCNTQYALAVVHDACSDIVEGEKVQHHYQCAIIHYEAVLKINHAILAESAKDFGFYDLANHNRLLSGLASVYLKQERCILAGDLYDKEATRYQEIFPLLSFYYSTQAIRYFNHQPDARSKLASCYERCANHAYQRQRYLCAIKHLQKAIGHDPQLRWQTTLKEWQQEQQRQSQVFGEDLYHKLAYARDTFDEIQLLMLEELETMKTLPENITNKTTELIITLHSLLDASFVRFARDIVKKEKSSAYYYPIADSHAAFRKFVTDKKLESSDKKYAQIYSKLEAEQPYYYHDISQNQKTPGLWKDSWLEKIVAMSNSGKHIGLTPQSQSENLAERRGTLAARQLQIVISYSESRFYPWTFVAGLKMGWRLSDEKALEYSHTFLRVLNEKHYLEANQVVHPVAQDYLNARRGDAPDTKLLELQEQFFKQLEADFSSELHSYLPFVGNLLLRRGLQLSHFIVYADCEVEFHALFQKAFNAIHHILWTLGKARVDSQQVLPTATMPHSASRLTRETKDEKVLEKERVTFLPLFEPAKEDSPNEWAAYHAWVKQLAVVYAARGAHGIAGKHYHMAARELIAKHPSLAFHYYYKAFYHYELYAKEPKTLQEIYLECCQHYANQGLLQLGLYFIHHGIRKLSVFYSERLMAQPLEYRKKVLEISSVIDIDSYSQLEHIKQKFLRVEYLQIKCANYPQNPHLQQKLQNIIADIVIKLRHLLDQAFTRLVCSKIYFPNQTLLAMGARNTIKFYAFSSLQKMQDQLTASKILQKDKTKVSLDRDFSDIYQKLLQAQPFSGEVTENRWLREIISLSNQAKHTGLVFSTLDECARIQQLLKDAVPYIEKTLQVINQPLSHVTSAASRYSPCFFPPAIVEEVPNEELKEEKSITQSLNIKHTVS